ncbi:hypothetical protein HMPREF0201_03195 [Cedecea davisae DSM 4568]|uniref:Uncharacterized protein n=1 Tax=Cedecea davisae DSM 4568 TaxID=566551 RepID=S3IT14_9ENTR|nr:hypothetical protein HMPREF0201_03195 [Cedecea davisae DSM 4568]
MVLIKIKEEVFLGGGVIILHVFLLLGGDNKYDAPFIFLLLRMEGGDK